MGTKTPLDDMLLALADRHRRRILLALLDGDPQTVDDIAVRDGERTDEQRLKHRQIHLLHNHLPHLAEAGLVRWERGAGTVEKGPRFAEIRPLIQLLERHRETLPATVS
ncbi:DUF7344 domain-containing protein [Halomicrobium salinisoli]|uniref:DUF7344 domain-containing protein n=1 Tax=Halomicrobium salinisoli TaxID=2878391 RepID=UPI001CF08AE8|nr:ArsR family transcriptional regulator [Halomicrobium salinisoli]